MQVLLPGQVQTTQGHPLRVLVRWNWLVCAAITSPGCQGLWWRRGSKPRYSASCLLDRGKHCGLQPWSLHVENGNESAHFSGSWENQGHIRNVPDALWSPTDVSPSPSVICKVLFKDFVPGEGQAWHCVAVPGSQLPPTWGLLGVAAVVSWQEKPGTQPRHFLKDTLGTPSRDMARTQP